ncbi:MAG: TonB family protein [Cyclobacteriaceae bacterium]|nr:TonB family protein [Cyclobacteriaceae bacterium]
MDKQNNDIERYREGSLSKEEQHALEKKALTYPFLADALEGAESISATDFSDDIRELSKKIDAGKSRVWFTPLRIAAGVIVMLGAGYLTYHFNTPAPNSLALEKGGEQKKSADSITSVAAADSASSLITMAKPVDAKEPKLPQPLALNKESASEKAKAEPENLSTGAVATEQQPSIAQRAEESPEKVTEEISAYKLEEREAVQLSATPIESKRAQAATQDAPDRLKMRKQAFQINQSISGTVVSADDGQALPGINIVVKGSTEGTVTDAQGNYQLNTQSPDPELVFSFIGMETQEVKAKDRNRVDVQMNSDVKQLSEVVVVGYGASRDDSNRDEDYPSVELATPEGGRSAFQKYLEKNIQYPAQALTNKTEGRVTVQFAVMPDGELTEFKILKGIGDGCDEELIRLIQQGPRWSPTRRNQVPQKDTVKVRLRFSLPK